MFERGVLEGEAKGGLFYIIICHNGSTSTTVAEYEVVTCPISPSGDILGEILRRLAPPDSSRMTQGGKGVLKMPRLQVSEKTLEINICAEILLRICRRYSGAFWIGMKQKQKSTEISSKTS